MSSLPSFIETFYGPHKERIEELERAHDPWSFIIHRTYYGPGSDEQWAKLLHKISDGVKQRLSQLEEAEKYPDAVTKVHNLFQLDAHSAPDTLEGLTPDDVRRLYQKGIGGRAMDTYNCPEPVFIFADAEILQDPELQLLKVVGVDHDPAAVHRYTRVRKVYFGWITIPAIIFLDLFNELHAARLSILAGPTDGPGALWVSMDYY